MKIKQQAIAAFILGIISLIAVLVSQMALADIYHGEDDLSLEWNALRICFAMIVWFQVFAMATFLRMIKKERSAQPEKEA
jgi:Na+/H+ antiporter NhaA